LINAGIERAHGVFAVTNDEAQNMMITFTARQFTEYHARSLWELSLRSPEYILVAIRVGRDWRFNPQDDFKLQPDHILVAMATLASRYEFEAAVGGI
jgi:uncharacterized protein with PhoU and TrkA domain